MIVTVGLVVVGCGGPDSGTPAAPAPQKTPGDPPWEAPPWEADKENRVAPDANSIARGKTIYQQQCVVCHGKSGKGDGPAAADLSAKPNDLSLPSMWKQTDGALYWKIATGRSPMPAFRDALSDGQIWDTVIYLRTLAPKP